MHYYDDWREHVVYTYVIPKILEVQMIEYNEYLNVFT